MLMYGAKAVPQFKQQKGGLGLSVSLNSLCEEQETSTRNQQQPQQLLGRAV